MAIPSGSGTEVLRNGFINSNNNATAYLDFGGTNISSGNTSGTISVPNHCIVTILNIIAFSAVAQSVRSRISVGGTTVINLFDHTVGIDDTFVFSEKIVLRYNDQLQLINSGNWADWSVNYIYQDWS